MGFVFDPYCCVNSLQEFFLANSDRGGYHNSQINGANSSHRCQPGGHDPKQQCQMRCLFFRL